MSAGASLLGEAELHGLVDGHLASERRADVLRKLAASPADRTLVEAWQEQNDLIRAAFRDVEHEALPVALDLAPPRLRCIDGGVEGGLVRPMPPQGAPMSASRGAAPSSRRAGGLATAVALLIVAGGLAGSWLMISQARQDEVAVPVTASPAGLETTLSDRATAALDAGTAGAGPLRIPDLSAAGLRLTGVSTQAGEPTSLVLQYRDGRDGRVVLGVASAPNAATTPPEAVGRTVVWRHTGTAYALAGTMPMERLRTLARSLQNGMRKN